MRSAVPIVMNGTAGITRDISATGVFFEIDEDATAGSHIEFAIELETPGGKLKLLCIAEVVRVENLGSKIGIAAEFISQKMQSM